MVSRSLTPATGSRAPRWPVSSSNPALSYQPLHCAARIRAARIRTARFAICAAALAAIGVPVVSEAAIVRADNTTNLDLTGAWTGGSVPGSSDVAAWSGTYATANSMNATYTASANLNWAGISIGTIGGSAAATVSIGGTGGAPASGSITIGSSGIDMSSANQNLVLNAATINFNTNQTWNIASGRNVRFGTTGTGSANANVDGTGGPTITLTGGGVVDLNEGGATGFSDAAGFAGFNGKWVIGSNTTMRAIRNGATAFGSNTASNAIALNGGTLAAGGITGAQGNWTWETPITLNAGTTSAMDQQLPVGSGRSLLLRGVISGSGNLVFKETGANDAFTNDDLGFILVGNNTMSGTVTIAGATENAISGRLSSVRVGGDGAASSVATTAGTGGTLGTAVIVDNGVLTLGRSDTWTFANVVSGTGVLRFGGPSGASTQIVTVSGSNSYTGGTVLQTGVTVKLGNASAINTTGTITVAGNGSIENATGLALVLGHALVLSGGSPTFTPTNDITINGPVSIAGSNRTITVGANTLTLNGNIGQDASARNFTKAGAGTLVLGGTGAYTGNTVISNGTLQLNNTAALAGTATVSMTGGTLRYSASNTVDYSSLFNTAAGQSVNIDTNGQSVTFGSPLVSSGGTLTKLGTGTLTLSGSSTYNGITTVSLGVLKLAGSINASNVTVGPSASLTGNGATANLSVDGMLAPGNSTGAITVANLAFGAASALGAELDPTSLLSDVVNVSGSVTLTSGTSLAASLVPSSDVALPAGTIFTLVDYATTESGEFALLTEGSTFTLGLNDYKISYSGYYDAAGTTQTPDSRVTLTVVPEPTSVGLLSIGTLALLRRRRRR